MHWLRLGLILTMAMLVLGAAGALIPAVTWARTPSALEHRGAPSAVIQTCPM